MYLLFDQLCLRKLCAIAAITIAIISSDLCAQSSSGTNWLVLKNSQSIEGQISLTEGRYSVATPGGSRIVIAEESVRFVADSIEDIYWDRWSRVDPSDSQSHINLFRWCLKNGLMDEAQKQIELVSKLEQMESQSEALARMAQELELVVARTEKEAKIAQQRRIAEQLKIRNLPSFPETQSSGFAAAPQIPSSPIDAEGRPVRSSTKNKIELVGFDEEVEASDRRDKPAWISNRQLDQESRAMSDGTVSFYKRHLERKLIENCAKCHDSRSMTMPLSRRSFGQTIPRRMSQQNLHFVMEQVDQMNPLDSALLSMATAAHGDQEKAAFAQQDPFIFDIKKWTIAVSHDPAKWLMQLSKESVVQQKIAGQMELADPSADAASKPISPSTLVPEPVAPANVDPYDPAAFNRK